jgi:H+/Cl- antiporter ClcA
VSHKPLRFLTQESILLLSIFKWVILASLIGLIVGTATAVFLFLLEHAVQLTAQFEWYYLGLPIVMAFCIWIVRAIAPEAEGHGTEKVIRAVHQSNGKMRVRIVPIKLMTTILTIMFGGSAGKEGPSAQIGAALASGFAQLFHFTPEDRKKLVICGISAGFTAVLGTPIAGAIFGVEVLFMGKLLYSVLLPSFISGMMSFQVASALGVEYHYHIIPFQQSFDAVFYIFTGFAGVFFGLLSVFTITVLNFFEDFSNRLKLVRPLKAFLAGAVIAGFALIFSTDYLGMGLSTIDHALLGGHIVWYAALLKILMTALTLGFGGSGGVLTPLFFIGATAGSAFAMFFGLDPAVFAAFGLVSMLAGAANTPLAACILAVELFGPAITPYATIACVISFFMSGYYSIFPSQVLSMQKTGAMPPDKGHEVEGADYYINYNARRRIVSGLQIVKKFFRSFNI